jgi:hypothetical protein
VSETDLWWWCEDHQVAEQNPPGINGGEHATGHRWTGPYRTRERCERAVLLPVAQRAFLDASVAVWREVDRLEGGGPYPGIAPGTDLRVAERAAWKRYRDLLDSGEGTNS